MSGRTFTQARLHKTTHNVRVEMVKIALVGKRIAGMIKIAIIPSMLACVQTSWISILH